MICIIYRGRLLVTIFLLLSMSMLHPYHHRSVQPLPAPQAPSRASLCWAQHAPLALHGDPRMKAEWTCVSIGGYNMSWWFMMYHNVSFFVILAFVVYIIVYGFWKKEAQTMTYSKCVYWICCIYIYDRLGAWLKCSASWRRGSLSLNFPKLVCLMSQV